MKRRLLLAQTLLLFTFAYTLAQLTPQDAAKGMMRGINIGNSLDAGAETSWGNPVITKQLFIELKKAGFTSVRVPATWGSFLGSSSPFAINKTRLDRVDTIVSWGLNQGLFIILNVHHDGWIKSNYNATNIERFDSLWSQIATRFKDRSDSLLFEIINEPNPISLTNINDLNSRTLATIRKTNPTRIVLFSGNVYSNSAELLQAAVPVDNYIMGYYHSYDPYPFGLEGPGTYGTESDIAQTKNKFDQVANWCSQHGLPAILGEYGYMRECEYNSRMCAYATVVDQAFQHGIPTFAWDDGGDFPIINRTTYEFNDIKDILIYTYPESPSRLQINNYADTLVKFSWKNRTTENDSILVERRITATGAFSPYARIAPNDSAFIDSAVECSKTYYYRLTTYLHDTVKMQSQPIRITNIAATRQPFTGTAISIPGALEVENFDLGIEGETYHDSDPANTGNSYRLGVGADIYKKGSTYYLYDLKPDEWLEYTVNVTHANIFEVHAYVGADTVGGTFEIQIDGESNGEVFTVDQAEGITIFNTIHSTCLMSEGEHKIRLNILGTPSFSINKLMFVEYGSIKSNSNPSISIYPNPAKDYILVKGIVDTWTLNIYDISGSLVKSVELKKDEELIPVNTLANGLYIIKCSNAQNSFCTKLIKKDQ